MSVVLVLLLCRQVSFPLCSDNVSGDYVKHIVKFENEGSLKGVHQCVRREIEVIDSNALVIEPQFGIALGSAWDVGTSDYRQCLHGAGAYPCKPANIVGTDIWRISPMSLLSLVPILMAHGFDVSRLGFTSLPSVAVGGALSGSQFALRFCVLVSAPAAVGCCGCACWGGLFVCLCSCVCVRVCVCVCVCLCVCLCVCFCVFSICAHLCVWGWSVCLSVCVSVPVSVYVYDTCAHLCVLGCSVCLSVLFLCLCPFVCVCVCLSVCLFVSVSLCVCVCVCVCLFVCLCLLACV